MRPLERLLSPDQLNELFEKTAQQQYTRELLFSEIVEVMMPVVAGMRPSVHASYQASKAQLAVSHTSVYNKIDAIDLYFARLQSEFLLDGDIFFGKTASYARAKYSKDDPLCSRT